MKKWFFFLSLMAFIVLAVPVEADVGPPASDCLTLTIETPDQIAMDCQANIITPMVVDVVYIWPMEISAVNTSCEMQNLWAISPHERQTSAINNYNLNQIEHDRPPNDTCTLWFVSENLIALRFY
jgi:hypothetical protein